MALSEFTAMQQMQSIFDQLDPLAQDRVLAWLNVYASQVLDGNDAAEATVFDTEEPDPFVAESVVSSAEAEAMVEAAAPESAPEADEIDEDFASLYERVLPEKGAQKVATAAYWLEKRQGAESWTAFEVNKLLKSIDVKLTSISIVLGNEAKKEKNPLIYMVGRPTDSTRSRKSFALTDAGVDFVEKRLR